MKYETQVDERGVVAVNVPFVPGTRVMVLVIEEPTENYDDLLEASQSSLDFWDNPFDDEDWNLTKLTSN